MPAMPRAGLNMIETLVFELPPVKIVTRQINVPSPGGSGHRSNQIEGFLPWQSEQAIFGFDSSASQEDAAILVVCTLIASRTAIDGARNKATTVGLPPTVWWRVSEMKQSPR
jgi:hypothetical protein